MSADTTRAAPDISGAAQRTVTIQTHDAGPLDVHLYEAGDGPPVLLLHGWPQDAWAGATSSRCSPTATA